MLEFFSYVGALVIAVWACGGGYIGLRWGWAGYAILWRVRKVMDVMVEEELSGTILSPEKDTVDFAQRKS